MSQALHADPPRTVIRQPLCRVLEIAGGDQRPVWPADVPYNKAWQRRRASPPFVLRTETTKKIDSDVLFVRLERPAGLAARNRFASRDMRECDIVARRCGFCPGDDRPESGARSSSCSRSRRRLKSPTMAKGSWSAIREPSHWRSVVSCRA